jgi:threonyl-tRNA synthetase
MILVTLANGSTKSFAKGTSGMLIAKGLGITSPIAVALGEQLIDLSEQIFAEENIKIVTKEDEAALEIIRHDSAHLLAQAVKSLYPEAKFAIGPTVENGFYYDIDLEVQLSSADLPKIEAEMHKLASQNQEIRKIVLTRKDALSRFLKLNEPYKVEIIEQIPEQEEITCYQQGDFIDLCRGPHGPSTKYLKHFKLLKISGSYWRGDQKKNKLQRIYGTAWASEKDLKAHLSFLAEAESRDHRNFGRDMDLFHFQEEAQGMVFWHPSGFTILDTLQSYIKTVQQKAGYVQVQTPILCANQLWENSGHMDKFGSNMFIVKEEGKSLKPMNCPCHVQIFKQGIKSYRDLPIRMAEFGVCHRNEASGALHGLMRVKSFTQDDAHIFCLPEQIAEETASFCYLLKQVYKDLGFDEVILKFADRPQVRAGSDEVWNKAESALLDALKQTGLAYTICKGEGAFYGPKIEFHLKDALGRSWQCGTLQLDFILPERLGAFYIGSDGLKKCPVLLHRAILGTFERFIGILLEHYKGSLPLWLAPIQVAVATIVSDCDQYATKVHTMLCNEGIRASLETENNTIGYKLRGLLLKKVPMVAIIGKSEMHTNTVSLRCGSKETKTFSLEEFMQYVIGLVKQT